MSELQEYLPLLLPLIIVQVGLGIAALIHVLRHPHYRFGSKVLWIPVVLLLQIVGPIVYFVWGRGEE